MAIFIGILGGLQWEALSVFVECIVNITCSGNVHRLAGELPCS